MGCSLGIGNLGQKAGVYIRQTSPPAPDCPCPGFQYYKLWNNEAESPCAACEILLKRMLKSVMEAVMTKARLFWYSL